MKAASADLIALLASGRQFVMVDTYTITLADGTVLTYTSGDVQHVAQVDANQPVAVLTG